MKSRKVLVFIIVSFLSSFYFNNSNAYTFEEGAQLSAIQSSALITETNGDSLYATDRLYLKDGRSLECKVIKVKPEVVEVSENGTGLIYEFNKSEIKMIVLANGKSVSFNSESTMPLENKQTKKQSGGTDLQNHIKLFGGISLPGRDFGDAKKGGAQVGFGGGLEITPELVRGFGMNFSFSADYNGFDVSTLSLSFPELKIEASPWITLWPMGGLMVVWHLGDGGSFYMNGSLGVVIGLLPELKLFDGNRSSTRESATATAFAWGGGGGFVIGDRIDIGIRYRSSEPEYEIRINGQDRTSKQKLKTTIVSVNIAIILN